MGIHRAACDLEDEHPKPPALYNRRQHARDDCKATTKEPMVVHQRQVRQVAERTESRDAPRGDRRCGELDPQTGDGGGDDGHVEAVSTGQREEMLFCGGDRETSVLLFVQARRATAETDTVDVRGSGEAASEAGDTGTLGERGLDARGWLVPAL